MTTVDFSVRSGGADAVPLRPPGALNPAWFGVFAGFLGAATLVAALAAGSTLHALGLALTAAMLGAFAFYLHSLARSARAGFVRASADGPFTCVRPRSAVVWQWIVPTVGLPLGVLAIVARQTRDEAFGPGQGAIWLAIVWVSAAAWLVKQILDLRVPAGLTVSPTGLTGVRGSGPLSAGWADVERAFAVPSRTGAKLVLEFSNRSAMEIDATLIGSDPNAVAAIIEHYRMHPDDREDLLSVGDVRRTMAARN